MSVDRSIGKKSVGFRDSRTTTSTSTSYAGGNYSNYGEIGLIQYHQARLDAYDAYKARKESKARQARQARAMKEKEKEAAFDELDERMSQWQDASYASLFKEFVVAEDDCKEISQTLGTITSGLSETKHRGDVLRRDQHSGVIAEPSKWNCPNCTLLNSYNTNMCEACDYVRNNCQNGDKSGVYNGHGSKSPSKSAMDGLTSSQDNVISDQNSNDPFGQHKGSLLKKSSMMNNNNTNNNNNNNNNNFSGNVNVVGGNKNGLKQVFMNDFYIQYLDGSFKPNKNWKLKSPRFQHCSMMSITKLMDADTYARYFIQSGLSDKDCVTMGVAFGSDKIESFDFLLNSMEGASGSSLIFAKFVEYRNNVPLYKRDFKDVVSYCYHLYPYFLSKLGNDARYGLPKDEDLIKLTKSNEYETFCKKLQSMDGNNRELNEFTNDYLCVKMFWFTGGGRALMKSGFSINMIITIYSVYYYVSQSHMRGIDMMYSCFKGCNDNYMNGNGVSAGDLMLQSQCFPNPRSLRDYMANIWSMNFQYFEKFQF